MARAAAIATSTIPDITSFDTTFAKLVDQEFPIEFVTNFLHEHANVSLQHLQWTIYNYTIYKIHAACESPILHVCEL